MKSYVPATEDVRDRVNALLQKYYPDLLTAGVRVDLVFATTDQDGGYAVSLHGYAAAAVVRKLPVKDRAMGRGDAEITIDYELYTGRLDNAERDALLDHELYHIEVQKEVGGAKRDAAGRPVLNIRKHDRQFGWFDEIARRHGKHAGEVQQANRFFDEAGQVYFDFATKTAGKPKSRAA